jgi:hypothetical protein
MSGIRRTGSRTVLWRCYIPEEIAVAIELQLADPLRDKPVYGARSQLITTLLIKHLSEQQARLLGEKGLIP